MVFGIPSTSASASSAAMYPAHATAADDTPSPVIDPASRVNFETQDRRVLEMVSIQKSYGVYDYLLETVVLTVAGAMIGPTHKVAMGLKSARLTSLLITFVDRSMISMPAILVALVYLHRVRPKLHIDSEDWICERLAIGALITAQKYIFDAHIPGRYWSNAAGAFSTADINRMEREFLALLAFEMRVSDDDLLAHYPGLLRATRGSRNDITPAGGSVYARRERTEYTYAIHPRVASPAPAPSGVSPPMVIDLTYPDSPKLDSPDSYDSDSPPVPTPPSARPPTPPRTRSRSPRRRAGAKPSAHNVNPYVAGQWPYPSPHGMLQRHRDMEARVRWYAAGPDPHPHPHPHAAPAPAPVPVPKLDMDSFLPPLAGPSRHYEYGPRVDSPRFEPFSPPTARYEPPAAARAEADKALYPWRLYYEGAPNHDPTGLFKLH